jgi:hypothetical protein
MKQRFFLLILSFSFFLFSCNKHKPEPIPQPIPDKVLVKDIILSDLPSPYYHFEYDANGTLNNVGFASGVADYDLTYQNGRLYEMINKANYNNEKLVYEYQNNKLILIKILNHNGELYQRCFLNYDQNGRLKELEWELKIQNTGFVNLRTVQFDYYNDGNLSELRDHRYAVGSQDEADYIDKFENYDNKTSVDGFSLFHKNNEHVWILPDIQIQKNNAGKITRTGDGINYVVSYNYTYNGNLPLKKHGDVLFTSGTDAGKQFQTESLYSYY